ncbi:MAG: iron chaperone [Blastocatellia bacterium]
MKAGQQAPNSIDEYIAGFPLEIQEKLEKIRATIRKAAPKAEEAISYMIPTFRLHGNLVHFAAFKKHLSFFPGAAGVAAFQEELGKYETSKGTIQFPLDKPVPLTLITKIVKFRVQQNLDNAAAKAAKKKSSSR